MKLNGKLSVAERSVAASSDPLSTSTRTSFSVNVEFLDSCDFHCPGCFVKRRNAYTEEDLARLEDLGRQLHDGGFEADEILLGPTDLFGCGNALEILNEPTFQQVFAHFNALTFTSTLQSDSAHIHEVMELIRDKYGSNAYIEIIVVFDMEAYTRNDIQYISTFERNLELVKDANIIFAFNIHDSEHFDPEGYRRISNTVNTKYNSHLKMVPSFFRSQKTSLILKNLAFWNLTMLANESNDILNNMIDPHFGGFTYYVYSYKNGELYSNPYIYDFNFEDNESLRVPHNGNFEISELFAHQQQLTVNQYLFTHRTDSCDTCPHLASCVGKNVLTFMENRDITSCFLPNKTFKEVTLGIDNQMHRTLQL